MARTRTTKQKITAAQNKERVLSLRLEGLTFRQIADKAGVSAGWACRVVAKGLESYAAESQKAVESIRRTELARLDALQSAIWPKAMKGEVGAVDRALKITETRAKLLGLHAPIKIAPTDPYGKREYQGGGLAALLREGD